MAIAMPVEAQFVLQEFLFDRPVEIPDDVRAKLKEFVRPGTVPVEGSINAAELIYARRDELPVELLVIGAEIAAMCAEHDFNGMGSVESRGAAIAYTIRQMPGVIERPVASFEPPEPLAEFVPAKEMPLAELDTMPFIEAVTGLK